MECGADERGNTFELMQALLTEKLMRTLLMEKSRSVLAMPKSQSPCVRRTSSPGLARTAPPREKPRRVASLKRCRASLQNTQAEDLGQPDQRCMVPWCAALQGRQTDTHLQTSEWEKPPTGKLGHQGGSAQHVRWIDATRAAAQQQPQPHFTKSMETSMPHTQTRCGTANGSVIVPECQAIDSLKMFAVHLCGIITVAEYLLVKTCHTCTGSEILNQACLRCFAAQKFTTTLVH